MMDAEEARKVLEYCVDSDNAIRALDFLYKESQDLYLIVDLVLPLIPAETGSKLLVDFLAGQRKLRQENPNYR